LLAAVGAIGLAPVRATAQCVIQGPEAVSVNETFTLCGPQDADYDYEWHGPGVPAGTRSRCITITGRTSGSYEYELIVYDGVRRVRCLQSVRVGGGALGNLECAIAGPTVVNAGQVARLCAPQSGLHTYSWVGPNGFTASTRCVDVTDPGVYDVTIRNSLTGYVRECSHRLDVTGGSVGGDDDCSISGPTSVRSGSSIQLCGPAGYTYRWSGPNNFYATSRCINVRSAGDYSLTIRNPSTGYSRRCLRTIDWLGGQNQDCVISGPSDIPVNRSVRLCGQSFANSSYRWIGPSGYASTSRCIDVTVPGTYELTIRDTYDGEVRQCSITLGGEPDEDQNPDAAINENCPRATNFWRRACRGGGSGELSRQELLSIARRIDERSRYFNWSNDLAGFCQALEPSGPMTRSKQVARNFVAMLANVSAGEVGAETDGGDAIGLDPDTPLRFRDANNARTVAQLINSVDQMLLSRRGNYTRIAQELNTINSGRGIGPTCQ
jgi:hypothetical protein